MDISGKTRLLSVIGSPVSHSLSPMIQNRFIKAAGLDYIYMAFEVCEQTAGQFTDAARLLNIAGFNVTMPLKEKIIPYLDNIDGNASLLNAVNTVVLSGGKLTGYNTDGGGFLLSLKHTDYDFSQKDALILGAGGAARAVALALAQNGFSVTIAARNPEKLERLNGVEYCNFNSLPDAAHNRTLLINATPLGMTGNSEDFTDFSFLSKLKSSALIYDLIYKPRETTLMREGKKLGFKVMNGLSDLLFQAALSFEYFTGVKPNSETVNEIHVLAENYPK